MATYIENEQLGKEDELIKRFMKLRHTTEIICRPLNHEDHMVSVTEDTSPPKWHLGHTTWFFENFLLKKFIRNYEVVKIEYDFIFNSYYRKSGSFLEKKQRPFLGSPRLEDVYLYRKIINDRIPELILLLEGEYRAEALEIFEIGINHEEQHQELLLMDIKQNFYENPLRPIYKNQQHAASEFLDEGIWHRIPQGLAKIGVERDELKFSFDNERDAHPFWLENYSLFSHLVTNDEYAAFIEEGGYDNSSLWLSDGWDIKEKSKWKSPLYWEKDGNTWWTFTHSGMEKVDLAAPVVHVSYYEADAFSKWRKARLPTEFEWETAANWEINQSSFLENNELTPTIDEEGYDYFSQIHGCAWEWTRSSYLPYPRFETFKKGLGEYNGKFMCNQMVLRGGSCITPRSHYRLTYRNFYYPHMRWQYSGIRLAKDEQ